MLCSNVVKPSIYCSCSPLSSQHVDQATAVAFEDQQKINLFARKNARLVDLQDEIAAKKVGTLLEDTVARRWSREVTRKDVTLSLVIICLPSKCRGPPYNFYHHLHKRLSLNDPSLSKSAQVTNCRLLFLRKSSIIPHCDLSLSVLTVFPSAL